MEKFPLRMIDNDLLVSELFRDPSSPAVPITALSVYLPTKTKSFHGNSIGKSEFFTALLKRNGPLITNPYVNEVTLRRQKPPLKCC